LHPVAYSPHIRSTDVAGNSTVTEYTGISSVSFCFITLITRPPLWSSGQEFLATDPEARVRFPALPDFLRSSGSRTVSTQPREYN
jgi:hypothetical protein